MITQTAHSATLCDCAAIGMSASSLVVVGNALRLSRRTQGPKPEK